MERTNEVNREYRDRLFKFIFGNPQNKEWTLSLYNAVNGSSYTDVKALKLNTIENAVYMGMKNDVSFLVDNTLSFYEQQSTFNPNMPMRFLIYAGMVYSKYVEESKSYHRYSSVQQKAPTPKCVCFYNGTAEKEDRVILSLKDAFEDGTNPDIEVKVTMININYGHNKEILNACRPLEEYAWFVDRVRQNQELTETLEEAIDAAIDELVEDSVIKPFLISNRAEVKRMCITEYDEARTFAEQREEGIEIGIEIGIDKGIEIGIDRGIEIGSIKMLSSLVKGGVLTIEQAATAANVSVSEFEVKMKE
ncbi:MAG: hypothetical protein IJP18_07315 [Oscillospiraceae bacterium]|nr:hypothetical protein [Oscillospiraceae bacterium]